MKKAVRWIVISGAALAVLAGMGALALRHPSAFFGWSAKVDGLALYSDQPFAAGDGEKVLEEVRRKLDPSALHRAGRDDAAFICNTRWRRLIFCVGNWRAGGLNYAPLTTNIFLSGGDVAANRLISPTGKIVPSEMTLAYFIAHEIAHTLTVEHVGPVRYYRRLPSWLKEACADRIARGSVWGRSEARQAYVENAPEMNWPAAAPYLRYNLLLGYLLEQERRSLDEVLASGASQAEVEERLRRFLRKEA